MSQKWSIEEEMMVFELNKDSKSPEVIVEELNTRGFKRTTEAIKKKIPQLIEKFVVENTNIRLEDFTYFQKLVQDYLNKYEKPVYNPKLHKSTESAVILLSDVHIGKIIRDQTTSNVIVDTNITLQRLRSVKEHIEHLIEDHLPKAVQVEEIVLLLCGDLVDGENIYASQPHHIDMPVINQVAATVAIIWDIIDHFANKYPSIHIGCIPGNHGRSSSKREAVAEVSNWDNAIYMQLDTMIRLSHHKNIAIDYALINAHTINVRGWTGLLRHIGVKGDTSPSDRAKLGEWYAHYKFDWMACGHFHQPGLLYWNTKPIFRNGSVIGVDWYSEELAKMTPPFQWVWGISNKRVKTWQYGMDFIDVI